jgi:hypothetical protein
MAVYVPFAIAAFISDVMTSSDEYAAIMLSAHAVTDYDYWAPPLAFLGSYPAWTLYFNSKGLRTDYFFAATTQDFQNVLENEKYQSIVLVGHGSYNSWRATDRAIQEEEGGVVPIDMPCSRLFPGPIRPTGHVTWQVILL